jgi:hypothetical protein
MKRSEHRIYSTKSRAAKKSQSTTHFAIIEELSGHATPGPTLGLGLYAPVSWIPPALIGNRNAPIVA